MAGHLTSGSGISLQIDETIVTASQVDSEPADLDILREDLIDEIVLLDADLKQLGVDYHDVVKRLVNDTGLQKA